jgi:hypothetical protein
MNEMKKVYLILNAGVYPWSGSKPYPVNSISIGKGSAIASKRTPEIPVNMLTNTCVVS